MDNNKKLPMGKLLDEMIAEMEVLEKEWDRLDHMGTQVERQKYIGEKMFALASKMTFTRNYLEHKGNK